MRHRKPKTLDLIGRSRMLYGTMRGDVVPHLQCCLWRQCVGEQSCGDACLRRKWGFCNAAPANPQAPGTSCVKQLSWPLPFCSNPHMMCPQPPRQFSTGLTCQALYPFGLSSCAHISTPLRNTFPNAQKFSAGSFAL